MKTTKRIGLILTSFVLASAVLMTSCKKKETDTPDTDTSAATDNNMAESASNDAVAMAAQASESGSVSYRQGNENSILSSCATVTVNTTTKVITVTFSGGFCNDGHVRSGSLMFDYSASGTNIYYRNPGFNCHITTSNYMVDGNSVSINKTVANTTPAGFNPATTNLTWSVSGSVTIVKAGNGGTITWNCTRTHTLLNTSSYTLAGTTYGAAYTDQNTVINWFPNIQTPTNNAAIIAVSGSVSGTTAKGESYTFNTTSPLVVNMNCTPDASKPCHHPIVQGAFDFKPGSKGNRHVDFGSGTCDNTCQVTITGTNGHTYGPYSITFQ